MNKIFEKVLGYIACVVVIAVLAAANYWVEMQKQKDLLKQINDLQVQLAHASIPLKQDSIRDSLPHSQQQVIIVDKTDYKKQLADKELIKDLQLELKQIKEENRMLLATAGTVPLTPEKDDSDSIFLFHDAWADFEVNTAAKKLKYEVRDSLATYIAAIPKHKILWGLIKWGTKGYQVHHVNFNPQSHVKYNQTIMVEK